MIIPPKLKKGDEIRIISPARSMSIISDQNKQAAIKRLESIGLKVTFSRNIAESDLFASSSIKSRIEDLHEAFADKTVKMILPTIGGFNCNQLLKHLDYTLIRKNPKILGGYSDITALQNAIYAKTKLVTYSSPCFSTFAMKKGFEYSLDYFNKCLIQKKEFTINSSDKWSDDPWYMEQDKRQFVKNKGPIVINEGKAKGTLIGGNLCTFNLLQGTEYMPNLKNSILFVEDDYESKAVNFDRDLQSLIHQPGFSGVKGIVIGRFQKKSEVTDEQIIRIIKTKKELDKIPVIANADFGHTDQMITYPIGGTCEITADKKKTSIKILQH